MKTINFCLLLLCSIVGFSQAEKENYIAATATFEKHFNNSDFNAIFRSFSPEMQAALPIDKTRDFLNTLKTGAGSIVTRQFVRYENTYAVYKTQFEQLQYALNISVDNNGKINGLYVKPFTENTLPKLERNKTQLILPFKDEWTVIWGGDTKAQNYHVESQAQKNAFDLVITNEQGKSYQSSGQRNEDFYAFGKELLAPCDAEVVLVVDGIKDNKPGTMNPLYIPGNSVILKTANNEYMLFAHFKQNSILVKQGQKIKQGEVLGLCGNSGNSSEPHLHFHIQNVEDMTIATGAKCYFNQLQVNGVSKTDYSPVQKEKIKN